MAGGSSTSERELRLDLTGMTCASCAARIERKLNKLEGVEATVNFATEQATVQCDPSVTEGELVDAVESIGYGASPLAADHLYRGGAEEHAQHHPDEPLRKLRLRLAVAILLTLPVALVAMISPLQFSGWEWLALALATPVVFWSGIGFHLSLIHISEPTRPY